ncbi:MAG: hypothetical protein ACOCXX_05515 [Planctomycetota bacterium]
MIKRLLFCMLLLGGLAGSAAAQQKLVESFDDWTNPTDKKPNAAGWRAVQPRLGYVVKKDDTRTWLDATSQPGGSSFHGWNWVVYRPLDFRDKPASLRLSFDVYFVWYTGPTLWLGGTDGKTTSGYGVSMMQHHTTGNRIDVVKLDGAEFKRGGGSGSLTGLYRKADLSDWVSGMGKLASLKRSAWERVVLQVDRLDEGAVRCRVYYGGNTWPVLDVVDREGIDPATLTHVFFSAKGTGKKHPVYLDNLVVETIEPERSDSKQE